MESLPWLFKHWIALFNRLTTIQWISTGKTNCTVHWIEIDLLDSTIQPLNNQSLFFIYYYIAFRHQTIPFGGCMVLLPLIKNSYHHILLVIAA